MARKLISLTIYERFVVLGKLLTVLSVVGSSAADIWRRFLRTSARPFLDSLSRKLGLLRTYVTDFGVLIVSTSPPGNMPDAAGLFMVVVEGDDVADGFIDCFVLDVGKVAVKDAVLFLVTCSDIAVEKLRWKFLEEEVPSCSKLR